MRIIAQRTIREYYENQARTISQKLNIDPAIVLGV